MPLYFPKIQEFTNLALKIFPNEYWVDVMELRNNPNYQQSINQTFCDIIQVKWTRVDNKANFTALCTIPCTPDHWDTVLAAILVSGPEFWKSTQNICLKLLDYFKTEAQGLLHPDNIQNFNGDLMSYLVQNALGTRENKFLTDPIGCIENMYGDILALSVKRLPEETEEEFKKRFKKFQDDFHWDVDTYLNQTRHIGSFQEELRRLEEYVSAT